MNLKDLYHRFRRWQKEGFQWNADQMADHCCPCCGNNYKGNYCPLCGQAAGDGRITWNWVRKSIMLLWGMDSRSFPYSIFQLLLRPGYFIGEYISGRRQVSYPPVKMLFIVVVLYAIIKQLFGISTPMVGRKIENADTIIKTINWMISHPAWTSLAMTAIMILPTWFLFHFAPRHTCHTLPEGIFIQMFQSTLMLLSVIFSRSVSGLFFLLIPFYYYLTYKQLFGYGKYSTLWRVCICFLIWILTLLLLTSIYSTFIYGFDITSFTTGLETLAVIAAILFAGYWISRRTWRKKNNVANAGC